MRCTKCGTENAVGKKFCSQCGSGLPIRCPNCATENTQASRFCGDSGAALVGNAEPAATRSWGGSSLTRLFICLAEGCLGAGYIEPGLEVVDESLAVAHTSGVTMYEAEMYRLKGELLLAQDASNAAQAEESFRAAIEVSRTQHAKSWELRATTSLARLLAKQGKRDEARTMLNDIYYWFTEGFDTADLKDSKALLDELGR
jgi:predicted ATPase